MISGVCNSGFDGFLVTCVMIHSHFSLPPQLSPIHQQYQHPHHQQHQHQHLPNMSTSQQHKLSVTPPPLTPDIIRHNPWRITKQSRSSQRQNQALGLFFHSWTPRPCSDPLCRVPHQQPRPLQTTSPSLCSPMTSRLPSMPSSGLLGIQIALCKEKDSRLFKSPVSAQFPRTAQLVLQDVAAVAGEARATTYTSNPTHKSSCARPKA